MSLGNFEDELQNILYYVHSILKEPLIAKKLYYKIMNSLFNLKEFPNRNPAVFHYKKIDIRKLLISNYVIIYQIKSDENQIFILHIFHSSQNYLNQI